jgi:uncharacterized protein
MKLQNVGFAGERVIEAYGDGGFRLTDGRHQGSIMILPHEISTFPCDDIESLQLRFLEPLLDAAEEIELVVLGTGSRQHFPSGEILQAFIERQLPLEVMDTGAACRTYNILVSESRRIGAAILAI